MEHFIYMQNNKKGENNERYCSIYIKDFNRCLKDKTVMMQDEKKNNANHSTLHLFCHDNKIVLKFKQGLLALHTLYVRGGIKIKNF